MLGSLFSQSTLPLRDMFPFTPQNCPSPGFPCMLSSQTASVPSPQRVQVSAPHDSRRERWEEGWCRGGSPASHSRPLCVSSGDRIRSGLSDVKAVAETSRKLKAKGEIPYWNRTAPCFTKIWHRRGTNNGCCVTRLYVLYHLSKPQT